MDIEIRTIEGDELMAAIRAAERAFSAHPTEEEIESWRLVDEPDRHLVAIDEGEFVASAGAHSLTLTVPGGEVPMAGVSAVGVVPTHRRRGILNSLMRRQLDDIREAGHEPVAGLWAAEGAIYWRYGYGDAAPTASVEIDRARTRLTRPLEAPGRMRMVEKDEALPLFGPVFEHFRAGRPGMWARDDRWWKALFTDPESQRHGFGALLFAVHEGPGGPDGYVAYRVKREWDPSGPSSTLSVEELIADAPDVYATLWQYVFGVDLIGKIEAWPRPTQEPLFHMLVEPRALGLRVSDGLWIRVVDVERALDARRYSSPGRLRFEVRDAFCPWAEGAYELEGGPDGGACRRTDADPELIVQAADLGAAYLGGVPFAALHRAGRVVEVEPGALRRADAMFGWDPPPYCSTIF